MTRIEFSDRAKRKIYDRQKGHCAKCGLGPLTPADGPEYDHLLPAALGGKAEPANGQLLCKGCHKAKSAEDIKRTRKADRQKARHIGGKRKPKGRPMPGTKASGQRKRMNGTVERW